MPDSLSPDRNEIPRAGEIIEADLGDNYVDAYVTEVQFDSFNAQVELEEPSVVESSPIPATPSFDYDPNALKQQLASFFPSTW